MSGVAVQAALGLPYYAGGGRKTRMYTPTREELAAYEAACPTNVARDIATSLPCRADHCFARLKDSID
jgi:hypothetical protein